MDELSCQHSGIDNMSGTVALGNSIVGHASATGADCAGTITDGANPNLDSDDSCDVTLTGAPNLLPLANNSSTTATHGLLPGSPAVDAGDDAVCAATPINGVDQRGIARPVGDACDLGAFEGTLMFMRFFPIVSNDG